LQDTRTLTFLVDFWTRVVQSKVIPTLLFSHSTQLRE
jgi:hypothetical protein